MPYKLVTIQVHRMISTLDVKDAMVELKISVSYLSWIKAAS